MPTTSKSFSTILNAQLTLRLQQADVPTSSPWPTSSSLKEEASRKASTTSAAAALSGDQGIEPIQSSLQHITSLLEQQNRTIAAQSDRIGQLTAEVDGLKSKMSESQTSLDRDRVKDQEKDDRIRQLEEELEHIRDGEKD